MSEKVGITLLEAGPYISFANCGLPYYIGGEIERREQLFVTSAEQFGSRFDVDVRTGCQAVLVDRNNQKVLYKRGDRTHQVDYDRLILATGTHPVLPDIPGLESENIFTLRTVPDTDRISNFLKNRLNYGHLHVLVIGGGYIGLEAAEQLLRFDIELTIVEMADQLMLSLDPEIAIPIQSAIHDSGAEVILSDGLTEVIHSGNQTIARLTSGREIEFDIGLLCIGVRPAVELAKESGIELGQTGAIRVDQYQRTSDPLIFAAGDNSETHHLVLNRPVNIPLAGPANKSGRIAGANAALDLEGYPEKDSRMLRFRGVLGTAVVRVSGLLAAVTGVNEKSALEENIDYDVIYMSGNSHANYYPGASPILMKILFNKIDGKILGAQAVGGEGVDKRIDVLATAIMGGMSIEDLEHLDLTYAPPVGSAKDIPIMAGFAGSNYRRGLMPAVTPNEFLLELNNGSSSFVLDVRTVEEFESGHIPGAINIPIDKLRERLGSIPQDRKIYLYCHSGYRSYLATRILLNLGWSEVFNVQGGINLISQVKQSN
jgi:NADPH-dependent 2,4-dienoyl-CoA reductase/sulfur reductase-like enzyme/rhodanese-related sulfurtransferase